MSLQNKFLIDSNALMEPFRFYYAFDLIPAYWIELKKFFDSGQIVVLDAVKNEVDKGGDDLALWLSTIDNLVVIPKVTEETIKNYQDILEFIKSSGYYKEEAFRAWAPSSVADPWLIASAKVNDFTLVTQEVPSGGLSKKTPNKKAKIPDIARFFEVKTISIYDMMRTLGIRI